MTAINYVRNLAGGGVVAAHGHRSQALPPAGTAAWPFGPFGVCCYKRRQSEVFFVWISNRLLQTSSF